MLPSIDADIRIAQTLPGSFYSDRSIYQALVDRVFVPGWHFLGDSQEVPEPGQYLAKTLLPGCLDEPLLLVRNQSGAAPCVLSNVCPHRGNLVVSSEKIGCQKTLRCRYHGRSFELDGTLKAAPEFQDALNFPQPSDSMQAVEHGFLGDLVFASLKPPIRLEALLKPVLDRVSWLPLDAMRLDPESLKDYEFPGNWALYCDNYLEGFHIPFVHPGLAKVLDYRSYRTELFPGGSLQLGEVSGDEPFLSAPTDHKDYGLKLAGYYFFVAPLTMLNFYPWGLSLNAVLPQGPDSTRVHFRSYVWDASLREQGAGGALDEVELEDEEVVRTTSKGVRSRLYHRGRYSPSQEQGVHHFHRHLLALLQ